MGLNIVYKINKPESIIKMRPNLCLEDVNES